MPSFVLSELRDADSVRVVSFKGSYSCSRGALVALEEGQEMTTQFTRFT